MSDDTKSVYSLEQRRAMRADWADMVEKARRELRSYIRVMRRFALMETAIFLFFWLAVWLDVVAAYWAYRASGAGVRMTWNVAWAVFCLWQMSRVWKGRARSIRLAEEGQIELTQLDARYIETLARLDADIARIVSSADDVPPDSMVES